MKTIADATKTELSRILREPWILLIIIGAPLLYPFIYNTAYLSRHETDVPVAICDLDRSAASRTFIRAVDGHELSSVVGIVSPDDGKRMLENGDVIGVFILPEGFEQALKSGNRTTIRAWISNGLTMPASDLAKSLSDCIGTVNRESAAHIFVTKGMNHRKAERYATPVSVTIAESGNTTNSYGDFIIPAILILILQQSLITGTAVSVARDRRSHAHVEHPESSLIAITGRLFPYWILFGIHAIILFAMQFQIWHIPFSPNLPLLAGSTALFIAASSFSGVIIGTFFRNQLSALLFVMFTTYPIFLLSGYAWPVELLPTFYQGVSYVLPETPFLKIVTGTGLLNGTFHELSGQVVHLGIVTMFAGVISVIGLKLIWKR